MNRRQKKAQSAEAKDEELRQYAVGSHTLEELDEKYPNRPKNFGQTLLFSEIFKSLFNPLNEAKSRPSGPAPVARRKAGPHGSSNLNPHEQRRLVIESFIHRWRTEVGDDFYPVMRLILPNCDGRDRGVYGLKEGAIGKLLVKLMKIDKNSDDGYALLHWKLPGQTAAARLAGDFAGRCFEVLSKRPMRVDVGDMTMADVNEQLDLLAAASGEKEQLQIFETLYSHMNAEELMWLIRIVLKQMKVGATEKTFLHVWHPNAEDLFSVSSSLRRVCWELWDPNITLGEGETSVALMQIFQPQLAQFQPSRSFAKMIEMLLRSNRNSEDNEFWIEEKLDGERMQLHMVEDSSVPGGKRFGFWSRKAKDYTYLYGSNVEDEKSSLTRYLKNAFADGVRNIILDGEMITWDGITDKILPFGTLKSAALREREEAIKNDWRPLFRVFDILYLNDQDLTRYTLRDRHNALEKAVPGQSRRLEVHSYSTATSADEIEPLLRKVISESSEGLVLKNPQSRYRLNSRNDDWMKVKPEYMTDFGEAVDVVIIGGYYGSGHRGGILSSYLGGLRADENDIISGANPEKCYSFVKVGGGFKAEDYAEIRHHTDGKWEKFDPKKPPREFMEVGNDKPDVWIRPSESMVMSVKAASVGPSDQFALGQTLRFPRLQTLRRDRSWDTALTKQEWKDLRRRMDEENKEREMTFANRRRQTKRVKKELIIAGQGASAPVEFDGPKTQAFEGLEFCVLSECLKPEKKSKAQLEALIKENGGKISQKPRPEAGMLIIADKKVVSVASLIKAGDVDIIRPRWLLDCVKQRDSFLLPLEPGHLFYATDAIKDHAEEQVDEFGDSYARDVELDELRTLLQDMPKKEIEAVPFVKETFLDELEEHGHDLGLLKGHMFRRQVVCFSVAEGILPIKALKLGNWVRFGGGAVQTYPDTASATHVVVLGSDEKEEAKLAADARSRINASQPLARIVSSRWIEDCWQESTLLDEERYSPV